MIKLSDIAVPAATGDSGLAGTVAGILGTAPDKIQKIEILRRSVDARRKSDVHFVYTVAVEAEDWNIPGRNVRGIDALWTPPEKYHFPYSGLHSEKPPIVVGMGPAGLFAALCLAEAGLKCVVLERGRPVEERASDVGAFWRTGRLDVHSNVQFGEGGAGAFSDGKLTTGVNDRRIPFILSRLVEFGAPPDILYLAKPHIGTDKLRAVVAAIRAELIKLGCDIRFGCRLDGLDIACGRLCGISVSSADGPQALAADRLILAPGNSARDTFAMLEKCGVKLSPKNFAVGVRIEHLQRDIDTAQYGGAATLGTLPASDYKLAVHLKNGRSVFTFCVCPGGSVVAAASEEGGVATNGMSEYARDGVNCNGGLLVGVTPEDFPGTPLSGIDFQRKLERSAFLRGGGDYSAPAQLVGDFLARRPSVSAASVSPTYRPGVRFCSLWEVLPPFICESLALALPAMEKNIRGFCNPDAVLTAVESRSSSPVRIDRTDYAAVGIEGLYPCGEGAGYAGGIMSAAADGIRCAEALCAGLTAPRTPGKGCP